VAHKQLTAHGLAHLHVIADCFAQAVVQTMVKYHPGVDAHAADDSIFFVVVVVVYSVIHRPT
jgi:hypothetical protein